MVRFEGRSQAVERAIREVMSMDPGQVAAPVTLEKAMDDMADKFWRLAQMVLFLGLVAVVLAVVGIYGVVSFGVSRRTREFGIRAALGATKGDIMRFVLRSGIKSIAGGLCAGLLLAVGISQVLARLMRNAPFALDTMDPQVYVAVSALLILAALTAMFRPALRAAGSDPSSALRQD
jgi:putative ABC transport system permease protein